jgi:hypothetical protein
VTNGKTPLYLTALFVVAAGGVLLAWQPYSVPSRWARYSTPVRSYLRAAVRHDSLALTQQSLSAAPVRWGLHASRSHPQELAVWARFAVPDAGVERGDTAIIVLETSTEVCGHNPIVLRLEGRNGLWRVAQASSSCFEGP